jgi:hypothetical protein
MARTPKTIPSNYKGARLGSPKVWNKVLSRESCSRSSARKKDNINALNTKHDLANDLSSKTRNTESKEDIGSLF